MTTKRCDNCAGVGRVLSERCPGCNGRGRVPRTEQPPQLPDVVAAVLVNAVRAMEAAALPEARELRELLRPEAYAKLVRRPLVRAVPQGDYECTVTAQKVEQRAAYGGRRRHNLLLALYCVPVHPAGPSAPPSSTPQERESRAYHSTLQFPMPDEEQDGATYVGMRWLRYILKTTEVPLEFALVGRKVMLTYGPVGSRDWIGWGPYPKGTWK